MREAQLMIATGQMGVGKSFVTNQLLSAYEKSGRKIVIFDPNNEDIYYRYKQLHFDILEVERAKIREKERTYQNYYSSQKRISRTCPIVVWYAYLPFTIYGDKMNTHSNEAYYDYFAGELQRGIIIFRGCE
jgi:DNA helicase HerA-like ATPase